MGSFWFSNHVVKVELERICIRFLILNRVALKKCADGLRKTHINFHIDSLAVPRPKVKSTEKILN